MIEQYLSNNNENTTITFAKNFGIQTVPQPNRSLAKKSVNDS
jgi:hypothetical protein